MSSRIFKLQINRSAGICARAHLLLALLEHLKASFIITNTPRPQSQPHDLLTAPKNGKAFCKLIPTLNHELHDPTSLSPAQIFTQNYTLAGLIPESCPVLETVRFLSIP